MATEKRLIDANFLDDRCRRQIDDEWNKKVNPVSWSEAYKEFLDDVWDAPTVDAVPVDDIILHHILIDNEGVPEVKLQIGDRYFLLRGDPVDVREVVHGRWDKYTDEKFNGYDASGRIRYRKVRTYYCDTCGHGSAVKSNYCPNCGAKMRGSEE